MRLRYELVDAASDNPMIQAYYSTGVSTGAAGTLWGTGVWGAATWGDSSQDTFVLLPGQAAKDDGRNPYTWTVDKRARYVRFRFQSAQPAASMTLRSVEIALRQSAKDR